MIIDAHGHYTTAPKAFEAWRLRQIEGVKIPALMPRVSELQISDDEIRETLEANQLKQMRERGHDLTIFSPRAIFMAHHIGDFQVSSTWAALCNDLIHRVTTLYPRNFAQAMMLPQSPGVDPATCIAEIERCVRDFDIVGVNLNPDPSGGHWTSPPLSDRHWYPLYEKLVELDIPALIHSASCCSERESYTLHFINEGSIAVMSLLDSKVFEHFPKLKIVISHSGGAIPYHMGRFRAWRIRQGAAEDFDTSMRKLYYETCNYSKDSLELLFKVIGTDNVLFGTENPGTGSAKDPVTGRMLDDLKPVVESIDFLTEEDRKKVFETNAKKLYRL